MTKRALRAELRARRDAFVAGGVPALAVPPPFTALLRPGLIVATYRPVGSEADPAALADAALAGGCRLALPHVVDRATPIRFLAWHPEDVLTAGPYGLIQPPGDASEFRPDIVLAPLLGFDRQLNRIGQGAGHYDRAFALLPAARRIGVAWSAQEVDVLVPDPWDVPLHAIATEKDWLTS